LYTAFFCRYINAVKSGNTLTTGTTARDRDAPCLILLFDGRTQRGREDSPTAYKKILFFYRSLDSFKEPIFSEAVSTQRRLFSRREYLENILRISHAPLLWSTLVD